MYRLYRIDIYIYIHITCLGLSFLEISKPTIDGIVTVI